MYFPKFQCIRLEIDLKFSLTGLTIINWRDCWNFACRYTEDLRIERERDDFLFQQNYNQINLHVMDKLRLIGVCKMCFVLHTVKNQSQPQWKLPRPYSLDSGKNSDTWAWYMKMKVKLWTQVDTRGTVGNMHRTCVYQCTTVLYNLDHD